MVKSTCWECGQEVPVADLVPTTGKLSFHAFACKQCYEELESDSESE